MIFPPHVVVGLHGRSGSGKSELARLLWERFKVPPRQTHTCVIHHLADPVFEALEVLGIGRTHPAFRDLSQKWGADLRDVDEDFLVEIQRGVVSGKSGPTVVILDGVRHANDGELCDLVVGLRSVRDGGLTAEQMLHASERQELAVDVSFDNDTPQDADRIADEVAELIKEMLR